MKGLESMCMPPGYSGFLAVGLRYGVTLVLFSYRSLLFVLDGRVLVPAAPLAAVEYKFC